MPGLEHVSLPSCTRGDESRLGFGNRTVRWGDVTPGTFVITYECVGCFLRWHAPTAAPLGGMPDGIDSGSLDGRVREPNLPRAGCVGEEGVTRL